jgi:hypothetical protein
MGAANSFSSTSVIEAALHRVFVLTQISTRRTRAAALVR